MSNAYSVLHKIFKGLWKFCHDLINPIITPVFAILNYFNLEKLMEKGTWYQKLFLLLSVVYFIATFILACYWIYTNFTKQK